jgi:hypothetical protein
VNISVNTLSGRKAGAEGGRVASRDYRLYDISMRCCRHGAAVRFYDELVATQRASSQTPGLAARS